MWQEKNIVTEFFSISLVTNEVEYFSSGVHLKKIYDHLLTNFYI